MKKLICTFLCLLIGLGIGIPLLYKNGDRLRAAEDNDGFVKVVDFEWSKNLTNNNTAANASGAVYAMDEEGMVFYFTPVSSKEKIKASLMTDQYGNIFENVIGISAITENGSQRSGIALRKDSKIYVWGTNSCGQFGNGNTTGTTPDKAFVVDPGIPDVASVLASSKNYYLITKNGDVYASGDNSYGQLGNGTTESTHTFVKVNISNVKKIVYDEPGNVYALTHDGKIYIWGHAAYNGKETAINAATPIQVYKNGETNEYFTDVVDISEPRYYNTKDNKSEATAFVALTYDGINTDIYTVGALSIYYFKQTPKVTHVFSGTNFVNSTNITYGTYASDRDFSFLADGKEYYVDNSNGYIDTSPVENNTVLQNECFKYGADQSRKYGYLKKTMWRGGSELALEDTGTIVFNNTEQNIELPLKVVGKKTDDTSYQKEEKYNNDVTLKAIVSGDSAVTCQVQTVGSSDKSACDNFINNNLEINVGDERIYKEYFFTTNTITRSFIVDLYKAKPHLDGYSTTNKNRLKTTETITITTPSDQSSWNTYSATITDSSGNTSDYTGGTLSEGTYTLHLKDSYGNTQDYQFEVKDNPEPTLEYTSSSSTLTYGDNPTKTNNTIGTFTLKYPAGEPTSTIKTIQLGTSGDESHFTVDTSGALKVKGNDLDAGTYSVTVSGADGNDMAFTKTVSITVNKKDQNNYQITNNANYPLQVNQEINITTSGNESGENETYTITNGNSVAQISNSTKFKLLSSGTFTLEATVAGNTNYNSKTVTKQITVSQLPTQNPPVSITSKDSFVYGDTYTPTYSGGQGSGAVSWTIENDNGTGAVLSNDKITVTGVGTFTLKVTKAGTSSYQESTATKVITVNKRKTIVKPKDVTKTVGQAFKDNGATYTPQPVSGDNLGTLTITSKYPDNQAPGRYTDGIQASGLSNPNYEFEYQEGTLIINSNSLPNNGDGYYKVTGTKGKNNWYISDVQISATGKNGYDEISKDGINFQTSALVYSTDGDYPTDFYLRNSSTGIIAKAIRYQLKIDQTPPDVPSLSMKEINKNAIARFINALSFGNWMNQAVQVTMTSTDTTSGIDLYEYNETSQSGTNTKTSTNGIVTYKDDVELTVKAKACDKAGNCSALSSDESIMIDTKAPTISGVKDKSEYKHYYLPRFVNVKDSYSGLSYSEYKKDGTMAGTIQNNVDEKISDIGEYEVYAIDNAGNEITISFKIVPLPDIETEIDGSDESKEIIDQIKDELEEIKDKIDETEKKDIEDWIKDAEDKWNSLRKKVVETDDKSAKVEGQGDTDFDPSVILIVDDITDQANDIPPLPRKAINVYDVYLQKGNVRIQPDGSIKVYLPYTGNIGKAMGGAVDSLADPIVYQIDAKDKVTEISCKREGNFVTFITDELLRYAISNDQQELNNGDDTCVVGPDGDVNTGDEVCGLPSDDGKQPEKKPDGSVEVPDGGKVEFPNGTEIDTPDGAIIHPDGSVTLPDGTEYDPDGNKKPNKQCKLDGIEINIDTDGDGYPDINLDLNGDCKPELNIDLDGDKIPDINIDSDGDGKADINVDKDDDGKADLNILEIKVWKPNKTVTVNGFTYGTMSGLKPYLNIDTDNDGKPNYNIDTNDDGIPDKNVLDNNSNSHIKTI